MRILISGGGTGGHVFPAIAIANALKKNIPDADCLFVGASGKLEMQKVPEAGYRIIGLPVRGLQRKLSLKNLVLPFQLVFALCKAAWIVWRYKPDIAIGVGGYASGPVLKMASLFGVPTLLQEQNSYPGITNKMLAKSAKKICVAFEGMERYFPKNKLLITGNPVRQDLLQLPAREEAIQFFGLDHNRKTICVLGGSLGARSLNETVSTLLNNFALQHGWQLIWQYGGMYESWVKDHCDQLPQNVRAFPFIKRMDMAYAAADLVVSRAGALTLAELMVTAKPCILVPSPNVAEDHQRKNAQYLVDHQAAVMILDQSLKDQLWDTLKVLLGQAEKLNQLSQRIQSLAKSDAADHISKIILQLVSR